MSIFPTSRRRATALIAEMAVAAFGALVAGPASTVAAVGSDKPTGRAVSEDWAAWYASYMAAEQAGTDLPT